jgi:hypothetical protein
MRGTKEAHAMPKIATEEERRLHRRELQRRARATLQDLNDAGLLGSPDEQTVNELVERAVESLNAVAVAAIKGGEFETAASATAAVTNLRYRT